MGESDPPHPKDGDGPTLRVVDPLQKRELKGRPIKGQVEG